MASRLLHPNLVRLVQHYGTIIIRESAVVLTLIFLFFLAIVVTMNTELLILVWVDSTMSWAIMDNPAADVYELFNHLYNYGVGFINLVAFSCLFLILFRRKQLSFTRNREVRMSLQVLCMVLGNLACFVFWEFGSMIEYDALNLILTETIDLLFFDITILPYLILNRSIHSQLKTILMAKSSHSNLKMDMRIIRVHPA
ncbi:hypothetical protein Y032_0001g203 [Ancylostoma ceylanicum]|uniref:Serpentine receptor class gamma n=1 Tax=Ancylostoma ceylanicum TaxID=53326 RepID=A0A016W4V5_9BILA|nr:hypothetical protein Y032_0001g203 [Ancylostoma ceylanicum]